MWRREGKKHKRLVFLGEQKSEEWMNARKFRITGSTISAARGKSKFKTVDQMAEIIRGERQEPVNESMLRGIKYEDTVRKWYEDKYEIKVKEVGFAFLEDHPHIGVSPDGLVGKKGLIEIKCPDKLYYPLVNRTKKEETFYETDGEYKYPSHIYLSHYDQMQTQMAVMERKWCDYLVYSLSENKIYEERIEFDPKYWKWLLSEANKFIGEYLKDLSCYIPQVQELSSEDD